jgi:hypothetical protein
MVAASYLRATAPVHRERVHVLKLPDQVAKLIQTLQHRIKPFGRQE